MLAPPGRASRRFGRRLAVVAAAALGVAAMPAAPAVAAPVTGATHTLAAPSQQWWLTTLRVADAWKYSKGAGITVAVVDSGVQASLPVLQGQVLPGKDFTGVGDDARKDYQDPDFAQPYGHGTGMAALIAATGAGGGFVGIAPAAKILPVRVTPPQQKPDPNAVDPGIKWAVDHGAKIINVSLGIEFQGCTSSNQATADYVNQHGAILLAATGDRGDVPVSSPAACVGVLGVGAVDQAFAPWDDESTGPQLSFVEPGVQTVEPGLDGTLVPGSGTSDSTAILSGILALVWSKYPTETPRQIVTRLLYNVKNGAGQTKFGTRIDDEIGYGMPLPFYALTENPPANAANPIYDAIDARLRNLSGSGSSGNSSGNSSGSAMTTAATTGTGSSSGQSVARVIAIVAVGLVLVGIVGYLVTRRRRPPPPGPPGYPGGYPPPGYGPPQ